MPRLDTVFETLALCLLVLLGITLLGSRGNSQEMLRLSGDIPDKAIGKKFSGPKGLPHIAYDRHKESSVAPQALFLNEDSPLIKHSISSSKENPLKNNGESKYTLVKSHANSIGYLQNFFAHAQRALRVTTSTAGVPTSSSARALKEYSDDHTFQPNAISVDSQSSEQLKKPSNVLVVKRKINHRRAVVYQDTIQGLRPYGSFRASIQSPIPANDVNISVKAKRNSTLRRNRESQPKYQMQTRRRKLKQSQVTKQNAVNSEDIQKQLRKRATTNFSNETRRIFLRKRNASGALGISNLKTADLHIEKIINGLYVNYCTCMGGYARTVNGCDPVNASVKIYDGSRHSPMTIEASHLKGARHEVECAVGKAAVSLPLHSFALLPGGLLIVLPLALHFPHDHYCMEHVRTEPRGTNASFSSNNLLVSSDVVNHQKSYGDVEWRAKVCFKHPARVCNWSRKRVPVVGNSDSKFNVDTKVKGSGLKTDGDVPCRLEKDIINWSYSELPVSLLTCPPGTYMEDEVLGSENYLSYTRGGVVFSWNIKDNLYINFNHDQFCISERTSYPGEYVASFCHQETNAKKYSSLSQQTMLRRKCCPMFQIFNSALDVCEGSLTHQSWIQKIYSSENKTPVEPSVSGEKQRSADEETKRAVSIEPHVVQGFPDCSWQHTQYNSSDVRLEQRGGVMVNGTAVDWSHFCFETFSDENSSPIEIQSIAYCLQFEADADDLAWDEILTISLMGVSCVCMSLTLMTYVCVPSVSDRISGGCVVSEVASLLVSFVLVIVAYLPHGLHGSVSCIVIGTVGHAVTLASFFWLNIICYDVHSTIRGTAMENRRFDTRRYLKYSCWGWGAPSLIAAVGAAIDGSPPQLGLHRPHTAHACFPSRDDVVSHWLYVYGPIAVLLAINAGLFGHLSYTIVRTTRRAVAMAAANCDVDCAAAIRRKYRSRVQAYCKLFLVMGLSWIAEVLSFQFHSNWVWIVTDSFNALRGVFIFFIFVYKPEIWSKVQQTASNRWQAMRHSCACALRRKKSTVTTPAVGATSHTSSLSVLSSPVTPRGARAARAEMRSNL